MLYFLKNFAPFSPYSLHFSNNHKKVFNKLLTFSKKCLYLWDVMQRQYLYF